jgi:hypothetical protein
MLLLFNLMEDLVVGREKESLMYENEKFSWPLWLVFSDGASRWKIKMTFLWAPREVNEIRRREREIGLENTHKMSHEKVCGSPHNAREMGRL